MFPRGICLPSGSWLTGWQFACLWEEEGKCKFLLRICSHAWCGRRDSCHPYWYSLVVTTSCLPPLTCSRSTLFCPYFLLIVMWAIKVRLHKTHMNHLQWACNRPGFSHCAQHKLRPKYSRCKLGMSLPPAGFLVTSLSLSLSPLRQAGKPRILQRPRQGGAHYLCLASPLHLCSVGRWHAICFENPTCFIWTLLLWP